MYGNKGVPLYYLGRIEESTACFLKSIEFQLGIKDTVSAASSYFNLHYNYLNLDDKEIARGYIEKSLALYQSIHHTRGVVSCYQVIGGFYNKTNLRLWLIINEVCEYNPT